MGTTLVVIQQGAAAVAEEEVQFFGIGSAGDPTACRRLVFPANVTPLLAPIVYAIDGLCANPDRSFNLDNAVMPHPLTQAVRTIGTTKLLRFEEEDEDVIVTEVWEGSDTEAAMTTALFRQFYEYLINAQLVSSQGPDFITWEPRDRTTRIYNVDMLSLSAGGGEGEMRFDVKDLREPGGGTIHNALTSINPAPTGLIDREVRLRMRIISEV